MTYLESLLDQQRLDPVIENALRARRDAIETILHGPWTSLPSAGAPRFYYGGSFAKQTVIAAHFDLDVVLYFPPATDASPKALYAAVERRLREAGHVPIRHNVSLRLRYNPSWHIDVVPGRALDPASLYANLYAAERDSVRQTSLKIHIDLARRGDRDTIRLLKLWKWRNAVPVGSFILELAAAGVLHGAPPSSLDERFTRVLRFFADSFPAARLVDPANSNNVVTADLHPTQKLAIASAARAACSQPSWPRVVW